MDPLFTAGLTIAANVLVVAVGYGRLAQKVDDLRDQLGRIRGETLNHLSEVDKTIGELREKVGRLEGALRKG